MAEFILKDWHGREQTYDTETIYVRDSEGNLIPFKNEEMIDVSEVGL